MKRIKLKFTKNSLLPKMVQHKVVLNVERTDLPLAPLELHKNGEWWCSYIGPCDAGQLKELQTHFEVAPLDPAKYQRQEAE
jgi:hypothetical protein